jgi:peptidyl-prolyl cis-trans isomerase D
MLNYMRRHAQGATVKILFWIIIAVFILWGVGSFTGSDSSYAASVNGEAIGPKDVRRMAQQLERFYRQLYGENLTPEMVKALDFKSRALDQMINAALLKQEARRLGFSVTDEEVRAAVQGMQALNVDGRFQRDVYFRYLRMQGISPTDFEAQQRDQLLVQKVQELVTTSIRPDEAGARELYRFDNEKVDLAFLRIKASDLAKDITPSDEEIAKQYEERRDMFREPERVTIEYVSYEPKSFESNLEIADADVEQEYNTYKTERYSDPEEIHARHILLVIPPDADDKKRDEIRARAAAVLERLKKGEDFAAVAKDVSEDKANKDKGGDLGFIRRGHADESFEEAAFALQPGGVSDVVETRRGLHVVKVEERKAAREKPLSEVKDEILKALRTERARSTARDAIFTDSEKANSGAPLADLAKARGLTVETPPPFAEHDEIRGLPPHGEVAKNAFATPPGQIGPVEQAGDAMVLFRVTAKNPSHVPELNEIRDKVMNAIRDEQATGKARARAEQLHKLVAVKKSLEDVATAEKLKVEETGPFTRLGDYVPRIGSAPELKKQAFSLTQENPVGAEVYVASGDAYIAVLKERVPADMDEFEKKKAELVKRHLDDQRQAAMEALLNQLKRRARIQVNSAALAAV